MDHIIAPLDTPAKAEPYLDSEGYVSAVVAVDLSDLIDNDFEAVLDILAELLVGSELLMDINYEVAGALPGNPGSVLLKVSGDPSEVWEEEDADD